MTMGIVVRLLRRQSRYQAMRDDDVDLETYQLRGEAGKTLGFASGPPVLDGDVLAPRCARDRAVLGGMRLPRPRTL